MIYRFDRFLLNDADFRLSADGVTLPIEPKALRLLRYLLENPNRVVTKQELFDRVWPETAVTDGALTRTVALLRKALGDSSRTPRFVETVPTVGFRFIASVTLNPVSASPTPGDAERAASSSLSKTASSDIALTVTPTLHRTSLLRFTVILGSLTFLAASASWLIQHRKQTIAPIHSIAVLPLDNLSGDPAQQYFADGITDELITDLARIPALRVVSRTSVMLSKGARKTLPEIARALGVDAVVEGSVVRSGNRVRVTAQLIDARTDRHLWAQSFESDSSDILTLQDTITAQIAAQAHAALDPNAGGVPHPSVRPEAFDAYLRARFFFNKQDFVHSDEYYQAAIAAAPNYGAAYAGLANALDGESVFGIIPAQKAMPLAVAAARRAIQLDPANSEAYAELGSAQTVYEWNWPQAEQNLTRAITLSPSDSVAEFKYSGYLDAVGRTAEAVTHMRHAVALDQLSFLMNRRLGAALYYDRHYDDAIDQLRRAGEMEPTQTYTFDNYISHAYQMKGLHDQAVDYDLRALSSGRNALSPTAVNSLAATYKRDGWRAYWVARIAAFGANANQGCGAFENGIAWLNTGDTARAFENLNLAVDRRCFAVIQINADPRLDPIRSDPRYTALLARLHLPTN